MTAGGGGGGVIQMSGISAVCTELNSEILTLDGVAIEQIGLNCETKWLKNFWDVP